MSVRDTRRRSRRANAEPFLWLQDGEGDGEAECGCRLVAAHEGSGPAFWQCKKHAHIVRIFLAAEKYFAAYSKLHDEISEAVEIGMLDGMKDKNSRAYATIVDMLAEDCNAADAEMAAEIEKMAGQ